MKEKYWIYYAISIFIYMINLYIIWDSGKGENLTLFTLITMVCLSAILLFEIWGKLSMTANVLQIGLLIVIFLKFNTQMLPFYYLLIIRLSEKIMKQRQAMIFSIVIILLTALIYPPSQSIILITVTSVPIISILIDVMERWRATRKSMESKNEELISLVKRSNEQKKYMQSAEYTARLRERNRLAARIHDKIGHGISGSILLLEGAYTLIRKNPDKAEETVKKATENLRTTVDDIRASLRDERSSVSEVGLAEIKTELNKLTSQYSEIDTSITINGDIDEINSSVWICIYDNLKEAISNLLKHSSATKFDVVISNIDKLVRIEIKDNGVVEDFKPDIGLESMEERCALLNGRCFFNMENGFKITMIFGKERKGNF